jgi:hypothetical protein
MMMKLDEEQRARLDAEWAFLNATREMMNIARRKPDTTTYNQAIYLSEAIAPSVLPFCYALRMAYVRGSGKIALRNCETDLLSQRRPPI